MSKGEIEYAIRKACEGFDRWNDRTGLIPKFCGYYYEALSVIEDATRIGAMVACGIDIQFDGGGELIHNNGIPQGGQ